MALGEGRFCDLKKPERGVYLVTFVGNLRHW